MRSRTKKRFRTGYKFLIMVVMTMVLFALSGCAAIKNYDWSGWWNFHKPIVETIKGWFGSEDSKSQITEVKNETTNVNVTVNGNDKSSDTAKTDEI